MNNKDVLKYLIGLGIEKLIEDSGQSLDDVIKGSNIQEAPPKEPANSLPKVDNTSFDDERMGRMGK